MKKIEFELEDNIYDRFEDFCNQNNFDMEIVLQEVIKQMIILMAVHFEVVAEVGQPDATPEDKLKYANLLLEIGKKITLKAKKGNV